MNLLLHTVHVSHLAAMGSVCVAASLYGLKVTLGHKAASASLFVPLRTQQSPDAEMRLRMVTWGTVDAFSHTEEKGHANRHRHLYACLLPCGGQHSPSSGRNDPSCPLLLRQQPGKSHCSVYDAASASSSDTQTLADDLNPASQHSRANPCCAAGVTRPRPGLQQRKFPSPDRRLS